jgi:hypothetical protein
MCGDPNRRKKRPMIRQLTTDDVTREITRTGSAPALAYEHYLAAPGDKRLDALVRTVLDSLGFAGGQGFIRPITVNDYLRGLLIVEEALAELGGSQGAYCRAVRAGMRVKVRDHHRIEQRRGLIGKVVGTYGGEEFTAVDVLFVDGQRRLFWPSDLEDVSSTKPWWLSLLGRDREKNSQ